MKTVNVLVLSIFLAILTVSSATVALLSKGLTEHVSDPFRFEASKLSFAFGSGQLVANQMRVEEFDNGYALLTSGTVNIRAEDQHILSYTIQSSKGLRKTAFFWRRSDDAQNVKKVEITVPGSRLIDLSLEPDWRGEISEFGFLVAGDNRETVDIGDVILVSESLKTKLQMTWQSWVTFEEWSQKSINFLYGGDQNQIVSLPLLITCFILTTLLLFWIFSHFSKVTNSQHHLPYIGLLFLLAWIVVDIRWSANNVIQSGHSLQHLWTSESQQTTESILDNEIKQYVQKLKTQVLGDTPVRVAIVGGDAAEDYFLQRAKYHLLPHSANVFHRIEGNLSPSALDFLVFIGEPRNIKRKHGWSKDWRDALTEIDRGEWGVVYRVR